jgi:NDP-sugar pyrophosphorylase family protein
MSSVNPTIIMAAGKGSRMKADAAVAPEILAEVRSRPKPMIRIGCDHRPLLEHLLLQLKEEGCENAGLVIAEDDSLTPEHFEQVPIPGMKLSFVRQGIPPNRSKPLGTAHAVQLALEAHPEWENQSVTIANGDNLPPKGMFTRLFEHKAALPAFHPQFLGLPSGRINAFAVIEADAQGRMTRIVEKPSQQEVQAALWNDGEVRVSMNYFRVPYPALLDAVRTVPEHAVRREKEIPTAISMLQASGRCDLLALPMEGAFLDMTHPQDVKNAGRIVDQGGFELNFRT